MEDNAFLTCAGVLPRELRMAALACHAGGPKPWEELRLRAGRGMSFLWSGGELGVLEDPLAVTSHSLRTVLELATGSSYQTAAEQLRRGFYTMKGGHRIGVTGAVARRDGEVVAFRELSSLTIRIARQLYGVARSLEGQLMEDGAFPSTLILAPPGCGKTTLLRELLRLLSDGHGLRTALADERGEVAALWKGVPQLDVGRHTDVLDGCAKAEGMVMLLRSMNPQVLAADEITAPEDINAISMAANCGVSVLATAHGGDVSELERRPLYRKLLAQKVFRRVILILREEDGARHYRVEALEC